jgi:hypothetical protein
MQLPACRKLETIPRSGKLAQPPETKGATRLEAEVGMQLSACRKSETIREAAHWHSRRRRKEQRDWRRRWECSFRLAGNQKPSAKRLTGTATGDERSNATGGGGGNAAFGLPEIGKHREAAHWHSHWRRKEQRDWRRRWECSFRLAGNRKTPRSGSLAQPPETKGATRLEAEVGMQLSACRKSENTAKRLTGTATGDERSNATGGGGGNAAFGLPKIRNHPRSGSLAQPPET